jgi:DNA-binding SARP family transcriptional activator
MLAIADQHRHRPVRSEATAFQLALRALSDPAAALPDLRREAAAADMGEDPLRRGRVRAALVAAAAEAGAWEEAAAAARTLLAHAESMDAEPERHGWTRLALLTLVESALVGGRIGEARDWLEQIVPDGTPANEFWAEAQPLSLRAWWLAEDGQASAAELAAAKDAVSECADRRLQAIMQSHLALAAKRLGDAETAGQLAKMARPALLACGSAARLELLEERLGSTSPVPPIESPAVSEAPTAPAAGLQVQLMGGFAVQVNGRAISPEAWGSRKARNLFKYLLLRRGRPVLAGDLLEEFWPDLEDDGARHALRSTLHRMRRALEPERPARAPSAFLQVADDTVCLLVGTETEVDLFAFEDRLSQARRYEAQEDGDTANRLREAAIALYTGDLLPQDLNEVWALGTREGLREQYLSTLARLAEAALGRGEPAAALPFAERMLEADPTHEPGIRVLVRALANLGRAAEAVRRFDLFAQQLDRDLGLIPERETRELVDKLRRGR